jgi:hypothetical protein
MSKACFSKHASRQETVIDHTGRPKKRYLEQPSTFFNTNLCSFRLQKCFLIFLWLHISLNKNQHDQDKSFLGYVRTGAAISRVERTADSNVSPVCKPCRMFFCVCKFVSLKWHQILLSKFTILSYKLVWNCHRIATYEYNAVVCNIRQVTSVAAVGTQRKQQLGNREKTLLALLTILVEMMW